VQISRVDEIQGSGSGKRTGNWVFGSYGLLRMLVCCCCGQVSVSAALADYNVTKCLSAAELLVGADAINRRHCPKLLQRL